ncbi:hypothetical protein [Pseudocolwellia agarivorans]|uniref:hypothetical protein n=1 Tax=Pseudocolwellia agarivorans TaxID=1911682 RepID=UPI0009870FC7|nr:hypothetical protein [Pseudocolwellia agarivorans]
MLRNKSVLVFIFLSALVVGCAKEEIPHTSKNTGEEPLVNLCDLDESVASFNDFIKAEYGNEISIDDINSMKKYFTKVYKKKVTDFFYSTTEKVTLIGLVKECVADDNVSFRYVFNVIADSSGNSIFHKGNVRYEKETIIQQKRPFSFESVKADNHDYSMILSKYVKALRVGVELDEYMELIGCIKAEPFEKGEQSYTYYYIEEPTENIITRLTAHDFNKEIIIDVNNHGTGNSAIVKNLTTRKD